MPTNTAIIGMGRTGQAVARFLIAQGQACEAFDEAADATMRINIPTHVGPLDVARLRTFSRVVVSPGVNWLHPVLVELRDAGVPVLGDLDLFAEYFRGDLVAVTGTNGKTTTVSLISTMMDTLPGGIEAGGNIGTAMLDLLAGETQPPRVVLELSSFQLERAQPIRPRWAALLNLQPDHADMHENMASYTAAKMRLFARQGEGDKAMLPADAAWDGLANELRERGVFVRRCGVGSMDLHSAEGLDCGVQLADDGSWQLFWHHYDVAHTINHDELAVVGMHQHLNLAVAGQAAADFGVTPGVIRQSLTSFRGLPHRLQSLGVVAGREWINDSKATNPEAAKAALGAFHQVIWICGGLRKGLELHTLQACVAERVTQMLVVGSDAAPFMQLAEAAGVPAQFVKTVPQAVKEAARGQQGVPVLLSPAAASQDQFKDYVERGDCFMHAVRALEAADA